VSAREFETLVTQYSGRFIVIVTEPGGSQITLNSLLFTGDKKGAVTV
jgi:hypothetical protein